jgi:hypothetical protein
MFMKSSVLIAVLFGLLSWLPFVVGCGGADEPTPEKVEENRKKVVDRAERMRQEMNNK